MAIASDREAVGSSVGAERGVEQELARLAASVGPLRRVLAAIAGRLVGTRAHERLAFAQLGDYGRERAGISARQLQELARVDRVLGGLPALERALLRNALPWSKVRLIARVADAEDEAVWIERALAVPTQQLERDVRAAADEEPDPVATRRLRVPCRPGVRHKWELVREVAERVAGRRLTTAEVLEQVTAEACSEIPIAPGLVEAAEASTRRVGLARSVDEAVEARGPARCLPALVALVEGLEEADAHGLDARLRAVLRLEQGLDAAMAPLLLRLAATGRSPVGFAENQLGMSASKARALLRLERAASRLPELAAVYGSGELSWVKAQCLLPLLRLEVGDGEPGAWRREWVAWALRVSVRRLEADVAKALLLASCDEAAFARCQAAPERTRELQPMCAHEVDAGASETVEFRVEPDVATLYRGVSETLRHRLQRERGVGVPDGDVFEALLDRALAAWTLEDPTRKRRPDPIFERDGWRCAAPGCTSRRNLQDHHIVFRAAGGGDEDWNRLTLCAFHHHRGVHADRMRIRGLAPGGLVFELGVREDGPALVRYRSGDLLL